MVSIHHTETKTIRSLGVAVDESYGGIVSESNLLRPINPEAKGAKQRCPFKAQDDLCSLHSGEHKPFGCVASPFTLNSNDTLIVRNRYKLLRCYDDGPRLPAYVAFRASLDLIFGLPEASRICSHLANGGGDLTALMPELNWIILRDNDAAKRAP